MCVKLGQNESRYTKQIFNREILFYSLLSICRKEELHHESGRTDNKHGASPSPVSHPIATNSNQRYVHAFPQCASQKHSQSRMKSVKLPSASAGLCCLG